MRAVAIAFVFSLGCAHDSAVADAPNVLVPAPPPAPPACAILVTEAHHLDRLTEVVGLLDIHTPRGGQTAALVELRERAAALGADAVVGMRYHHEEAAAAAVHVSGTAVRYLVSAGR